MSFIDGFTIGPARAEKAKAEGKAPKVFDWDKAARIIAEKRGSFCRAEAGLDGDWDCTGGAIFTTKRADEYTFLGSAWATPQLRLFSNTGECEEIDCFIEDTKESNPNGWNAETKWPKSALAILEKAKL